MKADIKVHEFKDLTCEDLADYEGKDYYFADDVDDVIEKLEEEIEELEEKNEDLEESTDTDEVRVEYETIVLEFAKWCNKNRVNADRIPHSELEFFYEKFQHEKSELFTT